MKSKTAFPLFIVSLLFIWSIIACSKQPAAMTLSSETAVLAADWSVTTHNNEVGPNYDVVFPNDHVNQITITIAPDDWEAMQANMVDLFDEAGTGDGDFQPPAESLLQPGADGLPQRLEPPEGGFPQSGRPQPGAEGFEPPGVEFLDGAPFNDNGRPGGQFGGGDMIPENPMWVPATIEFNGLTWTNVGVRYKGNSSLTNGWRSAVEEFLYSG